MTSSAFRPLTIEIHCYCRGEVRPSWGLESNCHEDGEASTLHSSRWDWECWLLGGGASWSKLLLRYSRVLHSMELSNSGPNTWTGLGQLVLVPLLLLKPNLFRNIWYGYLILNIICLYFTAAWLSPKLLFTIDISTRILDKLILMWMWIK